LLRLATLTGDREQVYFKNSEMREMDDHFGDLYGIISDREIEISHELAQFVLSYETLLNAASDVCGELDREVAAGTIRKHVLIGTSLLALAQGAQHYQLCRPRMTEENIISIKSGWQVPD
jgi:DNA mismatch repair protein MSH5